MQTIASVDGTRIAYEKTGEGPPLVLVHGTPDDHTYWVMVQPTLAKCCTVYAMDRRGRGQSGDAAEYRLELEFDDVAAVVDMIDQPVILLGHSYGGLIALEAALRTQNLSKLIVYEPPIFSEGQKSGGPLLETLPKMEASLDEGKNDEALLLFAQDLLGMSSAEIESLRASPYWQVMVNAAPTLPRELRAPAEYEFDASRFRELTVSTLLLSASESPTSLREATNTLARSLANSRVTVLDGQGHDAAQTAPDLFADEVLKFARGLPG